MLELFALILLIVSITSASHWTFLDDIRTGNRIVILGYKQLSLAAHGSNAATNLYADNFSITFVDGFGPKNSYDIRVLFGFGFFGRMPKSGDPRQIFLNYGSKSLSSIVVSATHNFQGTQTSRISYFAYIQPSFFVSVEPTRVNLLQNCNADLCSFNQNSSLDITKSHIALIWISGYSLLLANYEMHFYVLLSILEDGKYYLRVRWSPQTKMSQFSYNALFFEQSKITYGNIRFVSWGWYGQSSSEVSSTHTDVSVLLGLNHLYLKRSNADSNFQITFDGIRTVRSNTTQAYHLNFTFLNVGILCPSDCKTCDIYGECIKCDSSLIDSCLCSYDKRIVNGYCLCEQELYKTYTDGTCKCRKNLQHCNQTVYPGCNVTRCYYLQSQNLSLQQLIKDPQQDVLYARFQINGIDDLFSSLNFSEAVKIELPSGCSPLWTFFQNGTITGTIPYSQNIHNLNILVHLNILPLVSSTMQYYNVFQYSIPTTLTFPILSHNGLLANTYSPLYKQKTIITNLVYFILAFALSAIIFSMAIGYKLVASQMLGILQLSYFGMVIAGNYKSPLITAMSDLKYLNGYNIQLHSILYIPFNLQSIGWSPSIVNNINIMLAIILIPLVIAFILFIVSVAKRKQQLKFQSLTNRLACEFFLLSILFLLYCQSFALGIFIRNHDLTIIEIALSTVTSGVFFTLFTIILVFYGKKDYNYFGQFKYAMTSQGKFGRYYYYAPMLERFIIGLSLGLGNQTFISGIVCILVLLGCGILVLVKSPYAQPYANLRVTLNYGIGICLISIYTYLNFKQQSYQMASIYMPYAILGLDIICIIICIVFSIKFIIKTIKAQIKEAKNIQQFNNSQREQEANKQLMEILEQQLINKAAQNEAQKAIYKNIFKKKKKKKKIVVQRVDENEPEVNIDDNTNGLTPERFRLVDEMLRNGLL